MSSAKLALVLRDIAGVVGGILVLRVLTAEPPSEASGKAARDFREQQSREGKSHPSRGSATKTIQHSHANPASYASYMGYGTAENNDFTENFI